MASGTDAQAPIRNAFPFRHKPNTLDRDRIVVPTGWDSWGKISVMRDGFEAKLWGEAWERDLEAEEGHTSEEPGAKKLYAALVPDQGAKVIHSMTVKYKSSNHFSQPPPLPPFNNPIPEQGFLAKNYDENAKKPDRDPRGAFRNPADIAGGAAGVVGPLGSSSFNLPTVERALTEMEIGIGGAPASSPPDAGAARSRTSTRTGAATGRPAGLVNLGASTTSAAGRPPPSPVPASSPSPTGGQTQHEVLQNFFQSLLSSKDRAGASAVAGSRSATKLNGSTSGPEEGNS